MARMRRTYWIKGKKQAHRRLLAEIEAAEPNVVIHFSQRGTQARFEVESEGDLAHIFDAHRADFTDEEVEEFRAARRKAYPEVGEQLEALWSDIQQAGPGPAAADMLTRIAEAKRKVPKPEGM